MNTWILTIDLGTRRWGVSVFHGRSLIVSLVKTLSPKESPGSRFPMVRKIFLSLCKRYAPEILVLEKPDDSRIQQSPRLQRIIGEVKELARKQRMKVTEFSPRTVRKILCQDERATKEGIVKTIGLAYPELKEYLVVGQIFNNTYWGRMVKSIALGICYLRKKERGKMTP